MPELINKRIVSCDQGYYKSICPACREPIKWERMAGAPGTDLRANHAECGLQFALITRTYEVWVADEHGNELGEDLTQQPSGVAPAAPTETPNTELTPGGLVMVKTPGDPS